MKPGGRANGPGSHGQTFRSSSHSRLQAMIASRRRGDVRQKCAASCHRPSRLPIQRAARSERPEKATCCVSRPNRDTSSFPSVEAGPRASETLPSYEKYQCHKAPRRTLQHQQRGRHTGRPVTVRPPTLPHPELPAARWSLVKERCKICGLTNGRTVGPTGPTFREGGARQPAR